MSTKCCLPATGTGVANSRITPAAAAISATVSTFMRKATNKAATISGATCALMIWRIRPLISS